MPGTFWNPLTGPGVGQFVAGTGLNALTFGSSAFSLPNTVFTPVAWSAFNSSGVTNPSSGNNYGNGTTTTGLGITPGLLSASQANLQYTINNSLATVSNQGAWEFQGLATILSNWGSILGNIGTENANTLQTAVNKSAKGCSGFLSCLFG